MSLFQAIEGFVELAHKVSMRGINEALSLLHVDFLIQIL
jgi:hypothetical protein